MNVNYCPDVLGRTQSRPILQHLRQTRVKKNGFGSKLLLLINTYADCETYPSFGVGIVKEEGSTPLSVIKVEASQNWGLLTRKCAWKHRTVQSFGCFVILHLATQIRFTESGVEPGGLELVSSVRPTCSMGPVLVAET